MVTPSALLVGVILTKNEARHIIACVESLRGWVDHIVVWDSVSDDDTCILADQAGALVVQRPFDNYAAQRQAVLESIDARWILFVDADERVPPGLGAQVQRVIQRDEPAGYRIPRRNLIVGRETRGGGFYPDSQLRLMRRDAARYDPTRPVHEVVLLQGPAGELSEALIHYNYESWGQFHQKQGMYAAFEAEMLYHRQIRPRAHHFVLQPLREFWRRWIRLGGWQDGIHGLHLAALLAWYYGFMPYWMLLHAKGCPDHAVQTTTGS